MKHLILSILSLFMANALFAQVDSAWLFLRVSPSMHTVFIDNQLQLSDSIKLPLGKHNVSIEAHGYQAENFAINLADTGEFRSIVLKPLETKVKADSITLERTPYAQRSAAFAMGTVICVSSGLYTSARLGSKRLETVRQEVGLELGLTGYTERSSKTATREYRTHQVVNYAVWAGAVTCAYYFYKNYRELKRIDRGATAFIIPSTDGLYGGLVWNF